MTLNSGVARVLAWFPRHAVAVLTATALLTAGAVAVIVDFESGRTRLSVDPSSDRLLPEGDASRRFFDHVRTLFGSDETLLVAYSSESAFSVDSLDRVRRMTRKIGKLDGVDRVLSLTNAVSVRGTEWGVDIAPFAGDNPSSDEELEALRREVLSDPIYGGSLVSEDGRVTALLVYFVEMSNSEFLERGLSDEIGHIARAEKAPGGEVWVTGGPYIRAETARILLSETVTLSLGILVALGGALALTFRSLKGVLLPLSTIVVAVVWTLAIIVWLDHSLNAVTFLVPPLLTALGLSYSVHVVSEFADESDGEEEENGDAEVPREAHIARVARATQSVALPVGLTGLTTAAGFASLGLSPLGAVREFGGLAVIGVLCTMVASLTFTPAALAVLTRPSRSGGGAHGTQPGRSALTFDKVAEAIARFDIANRTAIFVAAGVVFVVAVVGASQVRIGTQQISKFRPDAPVRQGFEAVNRHLGGANPFYVVVESDAPDAFKEPANLAQIEALQQWLDAQPEIGSTASVVDYVKLIHRGFNENDPSFLSIPKSRRMVSQLLFMGGSQELERFVDSGYQTASVHARARVIDSDDVRALTERIEARLAELPGHLEGTVTGTAVVLSHALDAIMRGQALSVVAALAIIYAILAGMFVSFRIGFIALIPNVLPVAVFFGALGWLGISLDPGLSLVAPLVLGIAVDDTIHTFSRFIREVRRTADEERATITALKAVGRPVTYTTLALVAGFLVLTTSELRSQAELGAMAAVSLAFAWLADFTLTPALCTHLRIATLWDLLTVDLGREPHRTISLLRGLRPGQARLVALLAKVVEMRAGERLFDAGEPGGAVYAVIDGELRASTNSPAGRIDIATYRHGDALGEVGLLHLDRTVDVDARSDARLLQLTQESIDQLARRYPRIATVVYRNLSGLAADRLVHATRNLHDAAVGSIPEPAPYAAAGSKGGDLATRAEALVEAFFETQAEPGADSTPGLPADARRSGSGAGGIDPVIARTIGRLRVSPEAMVALAILPLVEVAWADGRLHTGERVVVLDAARMLGIPDDSPAFELLSFWLERRPSQDLDRAWREAVSAVCAVLSIESRMRLRDAMVLSARRVAESAGGFAGVRSVSRREERVLARLEAAFEPAAPEENR